MIAIGLFAAVSYTLSSGSGPASGGISEEESDLLASEIVQYATRMKQVVRDLRMLKDCEDTEISFLYDSDGDGTLETDCSDWYYNANSPTDYSCNVFHSNGGGLSVKPVDTDILDASLSAEVGYGRWLFIRERINEVGQTACGNECADVFAIAPYVQKEVCLSINKQLGIPEYSGEPPQESDDIHLWPSYYYDGLFDTSGQLSSGTRPFDGVRAGCIEGGALGGTDQSGRYYFYTVLIER